MKHRGAEPIAQQFRTLRNRIEADLQAPAIVLVASATEGDGATFTAAGVADAISETNPRTALIGPSRGAESAPEWGAQLAVERALRANERLQIIGQRSVEGRLTAISIANERFATMSRRNVAAFVQELREQYDYIVVAGGDLTRNRFAMLLAASADATLIAFRTGRQPTVADRSMLDILERAKTPMLGVVMTDQSAIDRHEASRVATERPETREVVRPRLEVSV